MRESVVLLRGLDIPIDIDDAGDRTVLVESLHGSMHESEQDAALRMHERRVGDSAGLHHVVTLADFTVLSYRPAQSGSEILRFGFHRPRSAPGFCLEERRRARTIAPALAIALRCVWLQQQLRSEHSFNDGLSKALGDVGVMLLDDSMEMLFVNGRARLDLAMQPGDTIVPRSIEDSCLKLAALESEIGVGQPSQIQLPAVQPGPDRRAALATVQCIVDENAKRFLITTRQASQRAPQGRDSPAALGFTRREREIAALVAEGLGNPKIAQHICRSVRTVENHLRSIFRKAKVRTRTELARRMLDCG